MKRAIMLLLAVLLILPQTACSAQSNSTPQQTQSEAKAEQQGTAEAGKKFLIVYFSPANSDTMDAVSSATPRVGDISSVEYVAQLIGEQVEADMARIVATEPYPLPYTDTADQAKQEQNDNARPAFTLNVDPEEYDVIFFGYPIWWYHLPMIARSFFESYNFNGKTVVPFVLHAGSRDGGTFREIRELEPDATVLDGLAIAGDRADKAQDDVNKWLSGLSY